MEFNEDQKAIISRINKSLKKELKNNDKESAHCAADSLICELLISLGCQETVKIYEAIDKWYA